MPRTQSNPPRANTCGNARGQWSTRASAQTARAAATASAAGPVMSLGVVSRVCSVALVGTVALRSVVLGSRKAPTSTSAACASGLCAAVCMNVSQRVSLILTCSGVLVGMSSMARMACRPDALSIPSSICWLCKSLVSCLRATALVLVSALHTSRSSPLRGLKASLEIPRVRASRLVRPSRASPTCRWWSRKSSGRPSSNPSSHSAMRASSTAMGLRSTP